MLFIEELLKPISGVSPSGADLRYDPLMDSVRDARSKEDGTLPMGDWQYQPKRADYALVTLLASDGLRTRSKDLWLAVWLGEASLQTERYDGLAPVLHLLRCLQLDFWPSLYPGIEEGDLSLRAAPLHWAMSRYAAMLQEFPITADGVPYAAYRAIRSGSSVAQGEPGLTSEKLDASVAATPDSFYAGIEEHLALAQSELQELQNFCDDRYRDDSPTFVKLGSAFEELHHAASLISRPRLSQKSASTLEPAEEALPAQYEDALPDVPAEMATATEPPLNPAAVMSWADVLRQIESCVQYMSEQRPENPAAYLLALALQYGRDKVQLGAPTSEARLALKQARDANDATTLLQHTIRAMADASGRYWLDLYRYAWQAAGSVNAASLQILVVNQTRVLLEENDGVEQEVFADDTPIANHETQRWLQDEVRPHVALPPPSPIAVQLPEQSSKKADDVSAQAQRLFDDGLPGDAVRVLAEDAWATRSGRGRFLRRLEVTRLCLHSGHTGAAVHLLRQLLAESDERKLDSWEDPDTLGELLSLLLEALKGSRGDDHAERNAVYARLCRVNPAMALNRVMTDQEELWLVRGR